MTKMRDEKGFILLVTVLALTGLLGIAGLAIDVARIYLVRDEVQVYVDAAALAAAQKLDGTAQGVTNAERAVSSVSARWNFGTQPFTDPAVQFAAARDEQPDIPDSYSWTNQTEKERQYRFARVSVGVDVPLTIIRAVTSQPSAHVIGSATAGFAAGGAHLIQ